MPNKAYQKQLEFYINNCEFPKGEELKEMDLMKWNGEPLECLSKEEIFLLISTQKNCIFSERLIDILQYLINKSKEKYGENTIFKYIDVFIYGLMLGKAWERANIKY